jgi:hypothetical protein
VGLAWGRRWTGEESASGWRELWGPAGRLLVFEDVEWAAHAESASVQHVRVDHRSCHVAVAEQLLDGADVVAALQKVGRERVPKAVAGGGLREVRAERGRAHGPLQNRLVQMVAPDLRRIAIAVGAGRGEEPLPGPLAARVRVFDRQDVQLSGSPADRERRFTLMAEVRGTHGVDRRHASCKGANALARQTRGRARDDCGNGHWASE